MADEPRRWERLFGIPFACAFFAALFALVGNGIEENSAPDSSDCALAYTNVRSVLDLGVTSPDLLERVNSESLDEQCGEEVEIAENMEPGIVEHQTSSG